MRNLPAALVLTVESLVKLFQRDSEPLIAPRRRRVSFSQVVKDVLDVAELQVCLGVQILC